VKLSDHFEPEPLSHWTRWQQGVGRIEPGESSVRLVTDAARAGVYADAQLDDYHIGARDDQRRWLWRPPVKMQVRARASSSALTGTAGFGFWNDPFTLSGGVRALPEAIWFFYASPPSNMALAPGVPGYGWKAALVNTTLTSSLLAGVPTALAVLWTRLRGGTLAERWVQRLSGAHEAPLDLDWTTWHTFELYWQRDAVSFCVDGQTVLRSPHPPRGPLGYVAWVDNQFAVATPRGEFRFGTLAAPGRQWLELDWISLRSSMHNSLV